MMNNNPNTTNAAPGADKENQDLPTTFAEYLARLEAETAAGQKLLAALYDLEEAKMKIHDINLSLVQMRLVREMDAQVIEKQAKRLKNATSMNDTFMEHHCILVTQAYVLLYRGKMPTESHVLEFMDKCENTWPINTFLESLLGENYKDQKFVK